MGAREIKCAAAEKAVTPKDFWLMAAAFVTHPFFFFVVLFVLVFLRLKVIGKGVGGMRGINEATSAAHQCTT